MIEQIKQALENTTVEGHREIEDNARDWLRYLIGEVERLGRVTKGVGLLAQGNSELISKNHSLHYRVEELQKALEDIAFGRVEGDYSDARQYAREALDKDERNN